MRRAQDAVGQVRESEQLGELQGGAEGVHRKASLADEVPGSAREVVWHSGDLAGCYERRDTVHTRVPSYGGVQA